MGGKTSLRGMTWKIKRLHSDVVSCTVVNLFALRTNGIEFPVFIGMFIGQCGQSNIYVKIHMAHFFQSCTEQIRLLIRYITIIFWRRNNNDLNSLHEIEVQKFPDLNPLQRVPEVDSVHQTREEWTRQQQQQQQQPTSHASADTNSPGERHETNYYTNIHAKRAKIHTNHLKNRIVSRKFANAINSHNWYWNTFWITQKKSSQKVSN